MRLLQSAPTIFSASYIAQFQYLRSGICVGPPPEITTHCVGDIEITGTSDPSITCEISPVRDDLNWTFATCTSSCSTDSACSDVYLTSSSSSSDGIFANITFTCTGNTVLDVDSAIFYRETGQGQCAAGSDTRNFHVARLGVECPSSSGGKEYVFDDLYFECSDYIYPADSEPGNEFTCYLGSNCDGQSCNVTFEDLIINADLPSFQDRCVTPLVPVTPAPSPGSGGTGSTLGVRAEFAASWALTVEGSAKDSCVEGSPKISATCIKSEIALTKTSSPTIECTKIEDNILECQDNSTTYISKFANFTYTCTGESVPDTIIEYPESFAACDGNAMKTKIRHNLQLGVFCAIDDGFFFFGDLYFECGELSSQFDLLNELGNSGNRYTCSQTVKIPKNSTTSDKVKILNLTILTDPSWQDPDSGCISIVPIDAKPVAPSTQQPTQVQTAEPNASPVQGPSAVVSPTLSSQAPTIAPVATEVVVSQDQPDTNSELMAPSPSPLSFAPTGSTPDAPTGREVTTSKSNVGAIVGGAVGAVFIVCLAGLLAIYLKSLQGGSGRQENDTKPPVPFRQPDVAHEYHGGNNSTTVSDTGHHDDRYYDDPVIPVQTTAHAADNVHSSGHTHTTTSSGTTNTRPYRGSSSGATSSGSSGGGNYGFRGSSSGGQNPHEVRFKDQSRSVIAPATGQTLIVEAEAVQVVPGGRMDTSDVSDDRSAHTSQTGRTRQSIDP